MVYHLILHQTQGLEGLHFFPVRPVRCQGFVNIGYGADPGIDMDVIAIKPFGVSCPVIPLVVLQNDRLALLGHLLGFLKDIEAPDRVQADRVHLRIG